MEARSVVHRHTSRGSRRRANHNKTWSKGAKACTILEQCWIRVCNNTMEAFQVGDQLNSNSSRTITRNFTILCRCNQMRAISLDWSRALASTIISEAKSRRATSWATWPSNISTWRRWSQKILLAILRCNTGWTRHRDRLKCNQVCCETSNSTNTTPTHSSTLA